MEKQIGIIGCGKIAPFHADVIVELGHSIKSLASRTISEKVKDFREKYDVSSVYSDWREMVKNEELDAIWLLTPWEQNNSILQELIPYQIPIFAEKPVGLTTGEIQKLIDLQNEFQTKIQIGHNRRFYDFIPALRNKIESGTLRSVSVEIPETTGHLSKESKEFLWIHNSSHVVDLLYYLVGPMTLNYTAKTNALDETPDTFNAFLTTKNNVPVQISAVWNAPTNFNLRFSIDNRIYELRPIEFLNVYEGFDILEPNDEVPVRRYNPRKIYSRYAASRSNTFKPGFYNQAKFFLNGDIEEFEASTLEDMLSITALTEKLM